MAKEKFGKNENYKQEDINKLINIYHMAIEAGDNDIVQDAFTKIYQFLEKYIYKTLWDNYRTLMNNKYHREDLVQEVWLKIFDELKNYDPEKGAITTFIAPWIRHVVSEYASKNFRKTSVYYANAMQKINGAQNYCKQYGLNEDDLETITQLTGLTETTVKNTIDLMSRKDSVSYEALIDAGADYRASIKGPEESVIEEETEKNLEELILGILNEEEMLLLRLLMNPENSTKKHASYREIAEQMGTNIPKVKRQISKMVTKIKKSQKFAKAYPYIIAQEKVLENAYIPVMNEDDYVEDGSEDEDIFVM